MKLPALLTIAIFTVLHSSVPLLAADDSSAITPLGPPLAHPAEVHGVALSADGKWAATGCSDHFLRIWEIATGKLRGEPLAHEGGVYPIAFSPDSRTVVAGSDKGAKLWDVASGKLIATLPHPGFVYSVAFRPDGLAILTSSHDGAADGTARLCSPRPIGQTPESTTNANLRAHPACHARHSRDGLCHFPSFGKISASPHLRRRMICCKPRRVMLCAPCSRRCRVEGGRPSFLENWAKVISPRRARRNLPSWVSSEAGTARRLRRNSFQMRNKSRNVAQSVLAVLVSGAE